MDPNLHVKQGLALLDRILSYYPFVKEGDQATVALTREDWWVVADTLFKMDVPRELVPEPIESYSLVDENRAIELKTLDCTIRVEAS